MSHRNAPLTPTGRLTMIERVAAGTPQAHVAVQMGVSRTTVSKWWRRWLAEGEDVLNEPEPGDVSFSARRAKGLQALVACSLQNALPAPEEGDDEAEDLSVDTSSPSGCAVR